MRAAVVITVFVLLTAMVWWFWPDDEAVDFGPPPEGPPVITAPADGQPAPAADAVQVLVELLVKAVVLPPPATAFTVVRGREVLPIPVTVAAGRVPDAAGAVPTRCLVRLDLGDGTSHWRAVNVQTPPQPTAIRFEALRSLHGRVQDQKGEPVAAARVWAGVTDRNGDLVEAPVGPDGAFVVDVPAGDGVPLCVQAPGFAADGRWLTVGDGGEQHTISLAPECELQVQCAGVADSLADAVAVVVPADNSTALLRWPAFLQTVLGGTPFDRSGRAVVHGLPRDVEVGVLVLHPRIALAGPTPVALRREPRTVPVPVRLLPFASGRVVDGAGRAVAGATVHCHVDELARPAADPRWLLADDTARFGVCTTYTDREGRFEVGCPAAAASLTISGPGGTSIELRIARAGALARDLVLPAVASAVRPELSVPAPGPEPWWLRIKPYYPGFVAVAGGQPFAQPLQRPVIADVTVQVGRAGRWSTPRVLRDVAITGTFAVPAELLR